MKNATVSSEILKFIAATQLPTKKLLRVLGYSYDNTGRIVNRLIEKGYLEELTLRGNNVVSITKEGLDYLSHYYHIDKDVIANIRSRTKGDDNKERQIRLADSITMLNAYVPDYIDRFLEFEKEVLDAPPLKYPPTRQQKIDNIRREVAKREANSSNGNWFITTREIRELDDDKLRNLASVRAQGVLHLKTGNYVIYNHMSQRMRKYGDFEQRYKMFIGDEILEDENLKSIVFAKGYRVAVRTITDTPEKLKHNFLLTNGTYQTQYYVPLTYQGSKQLALYTIPNARQELRDALIEPKDIERGQNFNYDGLTKKGDIIYIAFECNLNELMQIYDNLQTIRVRSNIVIYCFPHQSILFKTLFGDRADVRTVPAESVFEFLS